MQNKILWSIRVLLLALIFCNMYVIYNFSSENAEKSTKTSNDVTQVIAHVTVKDYEEKSETEQNEIVQKMSMPVRKIAHMVEFGTLGLLVFLLTLTWKKWKIIKWCGSVLFVFLYALTDEYHQRLVEGRGPQFKDVLIDTSGAVILCTLCLLLIIILKYFKNHQVDVTRYSVPCNLEKRKCIYISDLHGCESRDVEIIIQNEKPDAILLGGDLTDYSHMINNEDSVYAFLKKCAQTAPTYYALGNHEIGSFRKGNWKKREAAKGISNEICEYIANTGVHLLNDSYEMWNGMFICGITSGLSQKSNHPNEEALVQLSKIDGYKVLLCHHPEYYKPYVKDLNFDIVLCGHAHGGHWRIFGRGLYAPGQGLFPKYTSGTIDNKCYICRGAGDHTKIPRFNNHREVLLLEIGES